MPFFLESFALPPYLHPSVVIYQKQVSGRSLHTKTQFQNLIFITLFKHVISLADFFQFNFDFDGLGRE